VAVAVAVVAQVEQILREVHQTLQAAAIHHRVKLVP
jgi:hypothetical protein